MSVLTGRNLSAPPAEEPNVHRLISAWGWGSYKEIAAFVKRDKPDIIHFQYMSLCYDNHPAANFLPLVLKMNFPSLKIVTTFHEFASSFFRLPLFFTVAGSDACIVTNQHHEMMFNRFLRLFAGGRAVSKIRLAPNVLPAPGSMNAREIIRQGLGLGEGDFLFIRFGIIHDIALPELKVLIDAFSEFQAGGRSGKLLFLGKKEDRAFSSLRAYALEKEIAKQIIFRTDLSHAEISKYLYAGDAGLAPYLDGVNEKRTALLALYAHNLPVISNLPKFLSSEFKPDENVVLVPFGSAKGWAGAMKHLAEDKAFREKLIEQGKQVTALHEWQSIAEETIELYKNVTAG